MKSILEYLEKTADRFPQKTAFICGDKSITFKELKEKSQVVGVNLSKEISNMRNMPVGIISERNIDALICMFGCLYSGNYYVLIDANLPKERIEIMTGSIDFITVIDCLNQMNKIEYSINTLNYNNLINKNIVEDDKYTLFSIRNKCMSIDPMYGIFTSGSTGVPKLVIKSHKALISFIENFVEMFDFSDNEILGNQFPFYFDASTKDIFLCLKCGITTHIIPRQLFSFPSELIEYLKNNKITTIIWVPSALVLVANTKSLDDVAHLLSLRNVFFVGEQMPTKQLNYWKNKLNNTRFINLYGSTEVAGNFLFYEYNKIISDENRLPTGKPFPNVKVFLLNEKNKSASKNEIGEICVVGETLSLGYYNNLELNNKFFVQNPLVKYKETMYKTGDLATYDEFGNIIWKSRKDYQIKHMGYRIELSEIETIVGSIPEVEECCCIYDNENKKIILFYQSDMDLRKIIGKKIRDTLPKYMYPSKYYKLAQIPHNPNGKIDRKILNEKTMRK